MESRDSRAFVFVGSADEWGFRMIQNPSLLLLNFYFFLVFVCAASLSSYLRCGSQYDVRYFSGFCLDKRETEIKKKRQRTCLCHCVSVSAWSVVTFFITLSLFFSCSHSRFLCICVHIVTLCTFFLFLSSIITVDVCIPYIQANTVPTDTKSMAH